MEFRTYDHKKDKKAVQRVWMECGWLEKDKIKVFSKFVKNQYALVGELDGEAECFVVSAEGSMQHLTSELSANFITGVTTSRVARKRGYAGRMTAELIAHGAEEGADVASLGMFEQGFYNQLGFGTSAYEHWVSFDPAQLRVDRSFRVPSRLTIDDYQVIHQSRLNRLKRHGHCNLLPANLTQAEMQWTDNGFGLGYYDKTTGKLTHHFWMSTSEVEDGPYRIWWMSYENYDQFLELMALVKSLGDQVKMISMREPAEMQFQDLLKKPFRYRQISEKSKFAQQMRAVAYLQIRINNLNSCLQKTHLSRSLSFNLSLTDPVVSFLKNRKGWQGISGEYQVQLGEESQARERHATSLPTLKASVNAFTRMWMGVSPATALQATDKLDGPPELLLQLDECFRLPRPSTDWDF